MKPTIKLIGKRAEDYIEYAVALRRKGKTGKYAIDDVLILIEKKETKIIDLAENYFFMYPNKTFVRTDAAFLAQFGVQPGAFRAAGENELSGFPEIPYSVCPLFPEEAGYVVPWVVGCAPAGEMINVKTASFSLWKLGAGDAGDYKVYSYLTPPVIPAGTRQFNRYNASVVLTDYGFNYAMIIHQMNLKNYTANYNDCEMRFELYDGTNLAGEVVLAAPPVVAKRTMVIPGFHFRRFYGEDLTLPPKIFMYQHGFTTPGVISEVIPSEAGISAVDVVLPALETRTHTGNHYRDQMYDIFTSAEAQHYYLIRYTSDVEMEYLGLDYDANVGFHPGTALVVEKRSKVDWSLVATYNLTPSTVDTTLLGLPVEAQVANCDGGTAFSLAAPERLTRFVLNGVDLTIKGENGYSSGMAPMACGGVLVRDGVEYPLLPVNMVTQDRLYGSAQDRTEFLSTGDTSGITFGTLSQPVLLWVGAPPGATGWTWGGVDAVGLDLPSEHIGDFGTWLREPISSSDMLLHQLFPRLPAGWYFAALQTNPDTIDGARYSTNPLYLACNLENPADAGDVYDVTLGYSLGGAEGVEEQYSYTAVGGETSLQVVTALVEAINTSQVYSASAVPSPYGLPGTSVLVDALPDGGYLTGVANVTKGAIRQSQQMKVVKATVVDGAPVVITEKDIHLELATFWYEF